MKTTRKIIAATLIVTFSAGAVFAEPRGRSGGFENPPVRMPQEVRDFRGYESGYKIMEFLRCVFAGVQGCQKEVD